MYKLTVPIILGKMDQYYDTYLEQLKKAKVDRVFLCPCEVVDSEEKKKRDIELLERNIPRLKEQGFEVGVWINSLGHGYAGTADDVLTDENGLTYTVRLEGGVNKSAYCPLDEKFGDLFCDWVKRLAATGASIILLDDDFRYSFKEGRYCCCEKHQKLLEAELKEPLDRQRMLDALTEGEPNAWRDAWLKVQGETLTWFAAKLRAAVDEVNPKVRMGHCAVLSTWDIDGVDSITLAKTFAGNNKPLFRLIGAPYWAAIRAFGRIRLGTVCEYERLQQAWCKDEEIEIFCEGDVWPRPRYVTPSAYVEGMDQVMRSSGTADGILKYMFDYGSSPSFETGYWERHVDNLPVYDMLEKAFEGKKAVGVRIFEPIHTLAVSRNPGNPEARCIPASLRFASDNNLPTQFEKGEQAMLLFGDAAELVEEKDLAHGAVLDAEAARILSRRGIDVGLDGTDGYFQPAGERFKEENDTVAISGGKWEVLKLKTGAQVESVLFDGEEKYQTAASYRYENAKGQRFLVYAFDSSVSYETGSQKCVFRSWYRAYQLRRDLPWLSKKPLDAICHPSPDVYMLVKKNKEELTVGLWNFFEDSVRNPKVSVSGNWKEVVCHKGEAVLRGNIVELSPIAPFGMACFTLK